MQNKALQEAVVVSASVSVLVLVRSNLSIGNVHRLGMRCAICICGAIRAFVISGWPGYLIMSQAQVLFCCVNMGNWVGHCRWSLPTWEHFHRRKQENCCAVKTYMGGEAKEATVRGLAFIKSIYERTIWIPNNIQEDLRSFFFCLFQYGFGKVIRGPDCGLSTHRRR